MIPPMIAPAIAPVNAPVSALDPEVVHPAWMRMDAKSEVDIKTFMLLFILLAVCGSNADVQGFPVFKLIDETKWAKILLNF